MSYHEPTQSYNQKISAHTVYPKKYAHGFVVLCFVAVMQSFIMNSHEVFIHIHQGSFAGTGAIVRLPQCQWSKPDGYGKISQCITTTKHSKAKTVCIFLGIYCSLIEGDRLLAAAIMHITYLARRRWNKRDSSHSTKNNTYNSQFVLCYCGLLIFFSNIPNANFTGTLTILRLSQWKK